MSLDSEDCLYHYRGVECDQCGERCWEYTSYFGDIRCDECAYEDETYRREILGECI